MKDNHYKMTIKIEDWNGEFMLSRTHEGDSPHTYDFANFCHDAAMAYGFTETQMEDYIKYTYEYD